MRITTVEVFYENNSSNPILEFWSSMKTDRFLYKKTNPAYSEVAQRIFYKILSKIMYFLVIDPKTV
jgi:hypothetical protein